MLGHAAPNVNAIISGTFDKNHHLGQLKVSSDMHWQFTPCTVTLCQGSAWPTPLIQFVQVTTNWKRSLPNRIEKGKKGKEQKLKTRTFLRRRAGHWPMTGIGSGRWPESVTLAHPPSNPPNTTNYQPRPANHL